MSKISKFALAVLSSMSIFQFVSAQTNITPSYSSPSTTTRYQGYGQPMASPYGQTTSVPGNPGSMGYSPYGQSLYNYPNYQSSPSQTTYASPYTSQTYTSPYTSTQSPYGSSSSYYNPSTGAYPTYNTQPLQPTPPVYSEQQFRRVLSSNESQNNGQIAYEENNQSANNRWDNPSQNRSYEAEVGASRSPKLEVNTTVEPLDNYSTGTYQSYQRYEPENNANRTNRVQNYGR